MWNRSPAAVVVVVLVMVLVFPRGIVAAETLATPGTSEKPVVGEDEMLYSCKNAKGPISVTLKPETELNDLLTWVMSFTCKNFVLDPRVVVTGKKVMIITPNKMTAAEAYRVFLVALSTINLTIVPKGNIYRVVEAAAAKGQTVPIIKKGLPDDREQFVRYVYRPSYAQAETMKQSFMTVKSDPGDIQVIGSILLITDFATHVRDMMAIAPLIDVVGGTDGVYTLPVKHADATKLAPKLEAFLGVGAAAPGPVGKPRDANVDIGSAVPTKIMVEDRTNTLVIMASQAGYLRVKALLETIDIPLAIEGGAAFHVYPLGNAIAEELALTLNTAIQGAASTAGPKPGAPKATAPTPDLGQGLEGPVRVIGEKSTNSIIVMSSGRDFLAVRDVIRQLDVPRRQVYIEAMILEVEVTNSTDLGASSHGVLPVDKGSGVVLGGVQTGGVSSLSPKSLIGASGLIGGVLGKSLLGGPASMLGTSIPSFGVLIQALASSANTNVLSTPGIIALDNEEAKYKVGTNIPYKKGITFPLPGTEGVPPQANIDRIDLSLELSIKPHISKDDTLLLEIKHDAKDLGAPLEDLGVTWTTRSFETRVLVPDQQTVVIGGLMQEREVSSTKKVPLFGDIPILGYFFKSTFKTKKKTNLVIMLTPYIIKDHLELQQIRERKQREHDEFVSSFKAFDSLTSLPKIDYRRKRGLVEDINRAILDVEAEVLARKQIHQPATVKSGPIEYPPVDPD